MKNMINSIKLLIIIKEAKVKFLYTILLFVIMTSASALFSYIKLIYNDVKNNNFNKCTMLLIASAISNILFIFLVIKSFNNLNNELNILVAFLIINFIIVLFF